MDATLGSNFGELDNTRFQEAAAHLHMGEWDHAIRILEGLQLQYPDDRRIEQMLQDAHFKSRIDAGANIRERRRIFPWRSVLSRLLITGTVVIVLLVGFWIVSYRLLPMFNEIQLQQRQELFLAKAQNLLEQGDLDGAEAQFNAVLTLNPDNEAAQAGLADVDEQRTLLDLYGRAVAADNAGDQEAALALYSQLQVKSPGYRDVSKRILAIRHGQDLDKLFAQVKTLTALGLDSEAMDALKQIQEMDVNYRRSDVADLLFALHLKQGQWIIDQSPPQPSQVQVALNYFNAALEQKPNDPTAMSEARLAVGFVGGREAYDQQRWQEAVSRLRPIYNERPGYLGDTTAQMLYVSLIGAGDQLLNNSQLLEAYEMYSQGCQLPLPDTIAACAKASSVIPMLTPTPTPTMTATPGPTPPTSTPTPTSTPRPLQMFRNKIVFKSDNPDMPGIYVMNADGTGREYVGSMERLASSFDALRESERFSPDGQYRVSTSSVDGTANIIMHVPYSEQWGQLGPKPVTRLTRITYDPVWSPDGAWIAFVTQENESDDVWLTRPDSSEQHALMRNDWEWDKHPTWSPDSQNIAFFSNREGVVQIFVMDVNGRNPHNISRVPWPEYDPIWVK